MGSYTFPQGPSSGRQTTVTTFSGRGASTTTASLSGLSPAPSSPAGPGYNQASCADATDCVAVGQYGAANGTIRSILETVAGGSSSAAAPSLAGVTPAPASSDPDDTLAGVSCPASGACVAVGSYFDASETAHAMVVMPPTAKVSMSLSPGTITADGQATTTATAKVSSGAGAILSFSSSDAGQKIGPVHDAGNGTYMATITASEKVGTATITATDESDIAKASGTAKLTQDPPKVHVSVTPGSITANGKSTATATVTLTGVHGEPVADQDVVVTTAGPGVRRGGHWRRRRHLHGHDHLDAHRRHGHGDRDRSIGRPERVGARDAEDEGLAAAQEEGLRRAEAPRRSARCREARLAEGPLLAQARSPRRRAPRWPRVT